MTILRLAVRSLAKTLCPLALVFLIASTSGSARADVFTNVPEANADGYQLVYTLPIEDFAAYNGPFNQIPYTVNNSSSITQPFDRVAYYLELDDGTGLEYAYASMDTFTSDISRIGLTALRVGASWQQTVSNLNVFSNSGNVTSGTGMSTGNIEFWHTNYAQGNGIGIPGANDSTFDFGDQRDGGGNYGSFQIHNHGAGETIFAYNQWGGEQAGNPGDLGIGSSPTGNPDWTFSQSTPNYSIKNLQVLVRPASLAIDTNLQRAIFQRDSQNMASVPLTGSVMAGATSIEARAMPRSGSPGSSTDWQVIDASPGGGTFAGSLDLSGGWYDIEFRSLNGTSVIDQKTIERVGVGEVFVIAGQSNSANHGNPRLSAAEDRVSAFDLNTWSHADDPVGIATGGAGSPWPALGDALVAELDVPVGFTSVGFGGTRVEQWLPGGSLYPRLQDALEAAGPNGARAVLWHQGEADNEANTSEANYEQRLETVIAQSRVDAGFDIPWGIAQVSFLPYLNPTTDPAIIAAQLKVIADDPLNFEGPMTDDLINGGGTTWRWDDIHFNEAGLREHADRWFEDLLANFDFVEFVGDFDADDDVDGDDLAAWSAGYGQTTGASVADGDADLDGDVDGLDFLAWQRNFGNSVSGTAAAASQHPVPEPTALFLALLSCAGSRLVLPFRDKAQI